MSHDLSIQISLNAEGTWSAKGLHDGRVVAEPVGTFRFSGDAATVTARALEIYLEQALKAVNTPGAIR